MTCPKCDHPRATLVDGTETCTWSEAWRHECEARAVCNMPTLIKRRDYLSAIRNKRGEQAWLQLRDTVAKVWSTRPAGGGV
jgi:hypothetical protein